MKLTETKEKILIEIVRNPSTAKELTELLIFGKEKCVKVHICYIRKEMAKHGLRIDDEKAVRLFSKGKCPVRYFVPEDQKTKLMSILETRYGG